MYGAIKMDETYPSWELIKGFDGQTVNLASDEEVIELHQALIGRTLFDQSFEKMGEITDVLIDDKRGVPILIVLKERHLAFSMLYPKKYLVANRIENFGDDFLVLKEDSLFVHPRRRRLKKLVSLADEMKQMSERNRAIVGRPHYDLDPFRYM